MSGSRTFFTDQLTKNHATPVLSCSLVLVFLLLTLTCFSASPRPWGWIGQDEVRARSALQALLTVIVPTCSVWPIRYIELASFLRSRIDMPLEMIIEDMVDGVIELRNPIDGLTHLMGSGTTVNGYTIRMDIGWKWWISFFEWWILAEFKPGHFLFSSSRCIPGLSDWLRDDVPPNPNSLALRLTPFTLASNISLPLLCLDRLPHGVLPSLDRGSKVILEFVAFSSSLHTFSTRHVVSAIPFIISDSRRRPRSLSSVLEQLTAVYGPGLVITSISNVSTDYEHALYDMYQSLSKEPKTHEIWLETLSIKARRREMFLIAFETALVRRGWLERWAIQVAVK